MSTALDNHEAHSILLISFPHQLLHALSALKYYRMRERIPEQAPAIILAWSFQSSDHVPNSSFRKILDNAICDFAFVTLIIPTLRARSYDLSPLRTLIHRIAWVRDRLHSFSIDAIFFAHDASADRTAQVLMQSFPKANAICFGDPPGFLYPQFNSQHQRNFIKRLILASRARGLSSLRSPALSIVTIDFYNNGSAAHSDVLVLPRSLVLETLASIQRGMDQIKEGLHIDYKYLAGKSKSITIVLLSNFSESGLTTENNELALYGEICKEFSSTEAKLIIKPHFGTSPAFLKKLTNCLSLYSPEILPSLAGQIPIEFFPNLVKQSNIISVSSASALLSHLFNKQISHALTANRIQQYFKAARVTYMLEANQAIENSLSSAKDRAQGAV
jgi:hypothetical protein